MPPNYNNLMNPSKRSQYTSIRIGAFSSLLQPAKFMVVIPLLFANWWRRLTFGLIWLTVGYIAKLPRKLAIAAFQDNRMQRLSLTADKVKLQYSKFLTTRYTEFLNIHIQASYLIDRYLLSSRFSFFNSSKRKLYEYNGVVVHDNEGFEEYLAKVNSEGSVYDINSNVDSSYEQHYFSSELNGNQRNMNQEVQSCPFLNPKKSLPIQSWNHSITQQESSLQPKMFESTTEDNIQPTPSFLRPVTENNESARTSMPHDMGSKLVNLKVNGRDLKIKISKKYMSASNSFKPFYPSISQNELEYVNAVKQEIKTVLPAPGYDDGSLSPIILRLAWHCCATYDKYSETGGSNGSTMRFIPEIIDEGNTGLDVARSALEPVKQKYPKLSYADLWTLAGCVAIEDMKGPKILWKPGRIDCKDARHVPENGRLPFADKDSNHIRNTFTRMGFNDQETVALLGCHGIGRCHKRYSGWEGKWTSNPLKLDNEFFKILIDEKWETGTVPETGRQQFFNWDRSLMMLNTDLELIRDENYRLWVERYANDEQWFRNDFGKLFEKLLELGIKREVNGKKIIYNK